METIRIPKGPQGAIVASVVITSDGREGRVRADLTIARPMQSSSTNVGYSSAEEALSVSESTARQQGANVFIIDDRT